MKSLNHKKRYAVVEGRSKRQQHIVKKEILSRMLGFYEWFN
jgi:hypothetical protein